MRIASSANQRHLLSPFSPRSVTKLICGSFKENNAHWRDLKFSPWKTIRVRLWPCSISSPPCMPMHRLIRLVSYLGCPGEVFFSVLSRWKSYWIDAKRVFELDNCASKNSVNFIDILIMSGVVERVIIRCNCDHSKLSTTSVDGEVRSLPELKLSGWPWWSSFSRRRIWQIRPISVGEPI